MSIVPFYILIFAIYIIIKQKKKNLKKKFSILNPKRFFRYLKLIINFKIIICITIFSIISNSITLFQNSKYENLYKDNEEIIFTSLEYKILLMLFTNQNKLITREQLLDKIWDIAGNFVNDNTLTVYIKRIREKLDEDIIKTVKGIGYRIDE